MSKLHTKGNWGQPHDKSHLQIARKALAMQYNNTRSRQRIFHGDCDESYEIQAILYALASQSGDISDE